MLGLPKPTTTPCQCKETHLGKIKNQLELSIDEEERKYLNLTSSTPQHQTLANKRSSSHHHTNTNNNSERYFTGLSRIETKPEPEPLETIYNLNETRQSYMQKNLLNSKDYVTFANRNNNNNQNQNSFRSKSASIYEKINSQIDKAILLSRQQKHNSTKTFSTLTNVTPLTSNFNQSITNLNSTNGNSNGGAKMQRYESLEKIYNMNNKSSINETTNVSQQQQQQQKRFTSKLIIFFKEKL